MFDWYLKVLRSYSDFSGRARRSEFWYFVLFNFLISLGLGAIDAILGLEMGGNVGILGLLYSLFVLIPSLAVAVRRLHDTDRTGWWILIGLIPIIGFIVLIVFYVQEGTPGENEYGLNPKEMGDDITSHLVE
ncbi:MAG TPA: DUF805 domain-containing protein [Saprospiraceae bacterium]|nr:DUF805 domain-containing protein [Saprospiraceae bacterium]